MMTQYMTRRNYDRSGHFDEPARRIDDKRFGGSSNLISWVESENTNDQYALSFFRCVSFSRLFPPASPEVLCDRKGERLKNTNSSGIFFRAEEDYTVRLVYL